VHACCFRCLVALVLSIVAEHLEDLVHVFLSVWKLSPHYEVVYPPRNRSVRILVKPHRCNSTLDESSVFVCDRLSTPEHPVGMGELLGFYFKHGLLAFLWAI